MTDRESAAKIYKSPQEDFWAGSFGTDYIARNEDKNLFASNLAFFSRGLAKAGKISSCIELGANIGLNLRALKLLYPSMDQYGVEINADAAQKLSEFLGEDGIYLGSIFNFPVNRQFELSLVKGVLIHINPDMLQDAYHVIYQASMRYIMVCEYYNPTPVAITYRGHPDRLFKRDFAGEMLDLFPDLSLVDYGFAYRRDPAFPQDDITWFLMERKS